MITVCHVKSKAAADAKAAGTFVYVGRPSDFGNPFTIGVHGGRQEVIAKYRAWWYEREQTWLRHKALREIPDGSVLGCFCFPKDCHGGVIAHFLNRWGKEPDARKT